MAKNIQYKIESPKQRRLIIVYFSWLIIHTLIFQYSIYDEISLYDFSEYDIAGYILLIYFGYRFLYKTISVNENFVSYNGYFKRIKIRYDEIQSIEIRDARSENRVDYNLIIFTSKLNRIEKIQKYSKKEIYLLIEKLTTSRLISEKVKDSILNEISIVRWEHD